MDLRGGSRFTCILPVASGQTFVKPEKQLKWTCVGQSKSECIHVATCDYYGSAAFAEVFGGQRRGLWTDHADPLMCCSISSGEWMCSCARHILGRKADPTLCNVPAALAFFDLLLLHSVFSVKKLYMDLPISLEYFNVDTFVLLNPVDTTIGWCVVQSQIPVRCHQIPQPVFAWNFGSSELNHQWHSSLNLFAVVMGTKQRKAKIFLSPTVPRRMFLFLVAQWPSSCYCVSTCLSFSMGWADLGYEVDIMKWCMPQQVSEC